MDSILRYDYAQKFLIPYIEKTRDLLEKSLKRFDDNAACEIHIAADLCIPHDVIRLCGGFATGCFVEWNCSVPVIPVDTNVNIDIISVFVLDAPIDGAFTRERFESLRALFEGKSSYSWNFHKGNHFISTGVRRSDGRSVLLIHSNEKEFKFQYNGLAPTEGNWYYDNLEIFEGNGRYIRLLVGDKALMFWRIAKMCEEYNKVRHAFLAHLVTNRVANIQEEIHKKHYYMPTNQSVAMGCCICEPGELVPILTSPGTDIEIFRADAGGTNEINVRGLGKKLLVPHGWGKTCVEEMDFYADQLHCSFNGIEFDNLPEVSLGKHPKLVTRSFALGNKDGSFSQAIKENCFGEVVDGYTQTSWYNKDGVKNTVNSYPGVNLWKKVLDAE